MSAPFVIDRYLSGNRVEYRIASVDDEFRKSVRSLYRAGRRGGLTVEQARMHVEIVLIGHNLVERSFVFADAERVAS